jgi:hypothetical protein
MERQFKNINEILNLLASGFFKANEQKMTLENVCNKVKYILNQKYPESFSCGQTGTSVNNLVNLLFKPNNVLACSIKKCIDCDNKTITNDPRTSYVIHCPSKFTETTTAYFNKILLDQQSNRCTLCNGKINKITQFHHIPLH